MKISVEYIVEKNTITYNAELIGGQQQISNLKEIMVWHRSALNEASCMLFESGGKIKNSITDIHKNFYYKFRNLNPHIPSQIVIKAEQECLASYRSIKSNKHKIVKPFLKKKLSLRLDKRIYSLKDASDKTKIWITTSKGREEFQIKTFKRLNELMGKGNFCDPLIFERDGKLWISLSFQTEVVESKSRIALGVDLGARVLAACSDGRLIVDKAYNARRRRLRHKKRTLQSRGTKSARKKLKRLRRKEYNASKNQTHLIANEILKTQADTIVIEDLVGVKKKKNKKQNKNYISQIPFYRLRTILEYKARLHGKSVVVIAPHYTSQIDSATGKKDGKRQGRRYYAKSGVVYDADINASINIARKSKLHCSQGNLLDGAGRIVKLPNVCKSEDSDFSGLPHYKPCLLRQSI